MKTHLENTRFGFNWGSARIQRHSDDDKKGWVIIEASSPKTNIQIYVTKTGKIRVFDSNGEWIKPNKRDK